MRCGNFQSTMEASNSQVTAIEISGMLSFKHCIGDRVPGRENQWVLFELLSSACFFLEAVVFFKPVRSTFHKNLLNILKFFMVMKICQQQYM